jgi:hypothetical protein
VGTGVSAGAITGVCVVRPLVHWATANTAMNKTICVDILLKGILCLLN